ncbi:MAG: tetratricopeptide repeat protein [bacterium]
MSSEVLGSPARESAPPAARAALAGALVLAVLLRAEYLRELLLSPFSRHLLLDSEWYDQAARALLAGHTLVDAPFRPPLYPLFLAGLYAVGGGSPWVARIVQTLLGLLQVAVCFGIANRTHGPRVAATCAVLAAGYGMFAYYEGEILTTALGTFLTTAAVLLLLEGDRRDRLLAFAGGGFAIGLAALAHASALPLAVPAILWALGRARRWLPAVAVAVGVAIPVGVVATQRTLAQGELVVLATQGGINFYIGNNPSADGKSALAPGFAEARQVVRPEAGYRDNVELAARTLAERAVGRELSAAEVSSYWFQQGISYFRDHPKEAIALFLRKVVFFWNGYEISNERDLRDQARRFTPILRFFLVEWAILLPFALFGLVSTGVRSRPRALLGAMILVHTLVVAAFFVCARFRQPVIPLLLPFAAAGILAALDDARSAADRPRQAARTALLLVVFFLVTNPRVVTALGIADVTQDTDAPFHRFNLAVLFDMEGNVDRAIVEYRAAADTGVRDPRVHLNLGNALARTGRVDEAKKEYREVLRIAPDYEAAVRSNLGVIAAQQGDWTEAVRQFQECLSIEPSQANALAGLGPACLAAGRFDEAIVAFRRALAAGAGPEPLLRRSLSLAYLEAGLAEDARREAETALRLAPTDVANVLALARVAASQGRAEEAEKLFDQARRLAPGAPAVERAIEEARRGAEPRPHAKTDSPD